MSTPSFIAPSSPLDRRQLGKYEVLCRLSTGGMSAIHLAHQKGLAGFKKLVVLKTILPDIGGEEDFVGMFLEEARITAVFNHPNIAQVYELDTDDGQLFMAMEFVQGCTLVEMARACRAAKESIPVGLTLTSVRDTALALHYAHTFTDARGRRSIVIHRDVAEKNIMVTYEGVTKLLDFGIAKALGGRGGGRTNVGMVKGTSGYMSPEQIRGEPLDPRSDIFALGVVLHECLTGLRLFHGKTPEEGMMAALRETVQPPSKWNDQVPPELDAVVLKALQRDREKRFATALEFAREIEKAAPGRLWYPEQIAEVVTKHFAERRAETRRLLESADFGAAELTGNIRVQSIMAQVRATAGELPRTPTAPAQKAANPFEVQDETAPGVMPLRAPAQAVTAPGSPALARDGANPPTSPARPKALRTEAPVPALTEPEDDEEPSRTIIERPSRVPSRPEVPTQQAAPHGRQAVPMRRDTGETMSITSREPDPRRASGELLQSTAPDWDDDDDEAARTTIATRDELPAGLAPPVKRKVPQPRTEQHTEHQLEPVEPRRGPLLVLLGVLFLLALAGVLVLFDVIPLR